jgi:hypothetical protein
MEIPIYNNKYIIHSNGMIYSTKRQKFMSPAKNPKGYLHINFLINKKLITRDVHRLIAELFIPNPDNLSDVNHINSDKSDNRVENLEWVTHQQNCIYHHRGRY